MGTESFFDLVERDTLQLLGEAMQIETSASSPKEDVIEKFISVIFDLAPLEDAMKFNEISSSPVKKEEPEDVEAGEEDNKNDGKGVPEEKSRKKLAKADAKPEICHGILRADLQKYTVPELRTYAKENLNTDTSSLIKLKKEQLVTFILEKLEEPNSSSSKKRPLDRHDGEPPGKKMKTDDADRE